MDAGNGATFALVPHVHPYANGIVSVIVGAVGNFGGVIGSIIFRYNGTEYNKGIYILGIIVVISIMYTLPIRGIWLGRTCLGLPRCFNKHLLAKILLVKRIIRTNL